MATFWDHLAELRAKLLWCLIAIVLGAAVSHLYHDMIIAWLLEPVGNQRLIFLSPLDPLLFIFKIDLLSGFVLALPLISWNVLSFLRPAVQQVQWLLFGLIFSIAAVLLLAGLIYSYLVVVPLSLRFLTSLSVPGIDNMITASSYLSFLLLQLFLMATLFQVPLFVVAGIALGAFNIHSLASKRPHIYIGGLILLALITPTTDLFSLGIVMIPALVLFEGSLIAGRLVQWYVTYKRTY